MSRLAAEPVPHVEHDPARPCAVCAADRRGDMWSAGPERKPVRVTTTAEVQGGTLPVPAIADPETERAMRLEQAGYEQDPATGEWRRGTWEAVGGP